MASMALSIRFMNTCCNCTRSAMILGSSAASSVHVDQLTLWRRFLVERTDTVDDFSRTIPILIDSGCCRTSPIKIGRFVCQPFYAAVGAGDGGSDGLLDFVCQRRCYFPQRAYTIDVCQMVLELSQF